MQRELNEGVRLEQGQYTMLLQKDLSETAEGTVYFSLPGQDDYLYEYDGDLEEVLDDLPDIYQATELRIDCLTPQATIVLEQLWDYFDRTGEQHLDGQHEYNFQVEGDTLVILPKDFSGEGVAISRDGNFESSFSPERFGQLMERFAIAFERIQRA